MPDRQSQSWLRHVKMNPVSSPVYCSRVNFTADTVSNHINLSNGNRSQITWVTWKTIPVKSLFIPSQHRTCGLIAQLRLLIYTELNQYMTVVWWDQFPEGEVCHWTRHQGTSVPNPCLNFKWAWASLFFTWSLHSSRPFRSWHGHSVIICKTPVAMCEIEPASASVPYPLIHPNVYQLPEESTFSLLSHSSRCFGH